MNRLTAILWHAAAVLVPRQLHFRRYHVDGHGVRISHAMHSRQDAIGRAFLDGVRLVVWQGASASSIHRSIHRAHAPWTRGFAVEGAAMGMALLDRFCPVCEGRVDAFLAGEGIRYRHLIEVGAGWAQALPWEGGKALPRMGTPLLRWLRADGFGFARALIRWRQNDVGRELTVCAQENGPGFAHIAAQGCGRAFWFLCGGSGSAIAASIEALPSQWHGDLWAGIGLAAVYAGGMTNFELEELARAGAICRGDLAQGAAFAAKARLLSEDLIRGDEEWEACDRTCQMLAGISMEDAAQRTDDALEALSDDSDGDAYEVWRSRIRSGLAPLQFEAGTDTQRSLATASIL